MNIALFLNNEKKYDAYNLLNKYKTPETCIFIKDHFGKPQFSNFAVFDSTEILDYSGAIISDDINNSLLVSNSFSDYELYHIYDRNCKNLIDLINISKNTKTIFCCESKEDVIDVVRKFGNVKILQFESFEKLLEEINNAKRVRYCKKI